MLFHHEHATVALILSFHIDFLTWLRHRTISKGFHQFLELCPSIWTGMDVDLYKFKVSPKLLRCLVSVLSSAASIHISVFQAQRLTGLCIDQYLRWGLERTEVDLVYRSAEPLHPAIVYHTEFEVGIIAGPFTLGITEHHLLDDASLTYGVVCRFTSLEDYASNLALTSSNIYSYPHELELTWFVRGGLGVQVRRDREVRRVQVRHHTNFHGPRLQFSLGFAWCEDMASIWVNKEYCSGRRFSHHIHESFGTWPKLYLELPSTMRSRVILLPAVALIPSRTIIPV